jgi:hypothetical protein
MWFIIAIQKFFRQSVDFDYLYMYNQSNKSKEPSMLNIAIFPKTCIGFNWGTTQEFTCHVMSGLWGRMQAGQATLNVSGRQTVARIN